MDASTHSSAARLGQLQAWLAEDPDNPALLADACDSAIAAGAHEEAQAHLATASRLRLDPAAWSFRQARLCIARRELERAAELLQQLAATEGEHPVLAHDFAYVRLLQGDAETCRSLLEPWLTRDCAPQPLEAIQALWLRAMHASGLVEDAWSWLQQQEAARLPAGLRGVASLLAVDAEDFAAARTLAEAALAVHPMHPEALVARATVALAEQQVESARGWLAQALQANSDDGRTWSMLGLASLQAREFALAQAQLERAVQALPRHIGSWHALGWACLLQQDLPGAHQAFAQALALDRNFAESHGAVGLVLALRGHREAAQGQLALAARLDPRNVTGRFAQALLRGEIGDAARLQALAHRLLDRPGFFGGKLRDSMPKR
ncbi:tetratricopeptide repeat protein [Ramlibacter sp. G-1-2-2]|uniref:Tetratricopeptide repeat protein n=1 Tax=Ramlibacter agri TaxID=2728837 RepID=A0A848GWF2_9BURK|nr:tetratricopeptide repeat protein [Ramlibacter agri]NML42935.1 tetratricopeptide repeat protein [Ramlibacter agri]